MSIYIEGLKKGREIYPGYILTSDFVACANGAFTFAKKDGEEYFIKAFLAPKIPSVELKMSPRVRKKKQEACERFKKNFLGIIATFNKNLDPKKGQLIYPADFREGNTTFFQFSPKIKIAHTDPKEVASYNNNDKLVLLKSLANAVSLVHMHGVVHSDIKFENVLIKKTSSGLLSTKIIDFDGSYFEKSPHPPALMHFDQSYMAPELSLYNQDDPRIKPNDLTVKADIFSLGVLMHEYCTGVRPRVKNMASGDIYLGDAVNANKELVINEDVLGLNLTNIIKKTLVKDYHQRPSATEILSELNSAHIDLHKVNFTTKPKLSTSSTPTIRPTKKPEPKSTTETSIPGFKIVSKKKKT